MRLNLSKLNALFRGRAGEEKARAYLEAKGFVFLRANFRTRLGELDLVMEDGQTLVFIEVKTRTRTDFGRPEEAVTPTKQRRMAAAAVAFAKIEGKTNCSMRFDIVSIGPKGLEHIPNAFGNPGGYTL